MAPALGGRGPVGGGPFQAGFTPRWEMDVKLLVALSAPGLRVLEGSDGTPSGDIELSAAELLTGSPELMVGSPELSPPAPRLSLLVGGDGSLVYILLLWLFSLPSGLGGCKCPPGVRMAGWTGCCVGAVGGKGGSSWAKRGSTSS